MYRLGPIVLALTLLAGLVAPVNAAEIVRRSDAAPSSFRGDFVETAVGPEEAYLNDYVTVECRHESERLVALKITVIEPLSGEETGH